MLELHTGDRPNSHFCNGRSHVPVSRQLDLNGRRYWILSEPHGSAWKASVVELIDTEGLFTEPIGIEATAETRGKADHAAERKLRRLLKAPSP